ELRANFNLQKERLDDDAVVEDKVLFALLVFSIAALVLRTVVMGISNWQVAFDPPGENHATAPRRELFVPALGNVAVKIAGAASHGLLAIRWLLAGEPANLPLIACFLLVASNTQLLTSTSLISHMKAILISVAL
ncbi:unnamed protein product, partial [Symbiodinium pilosum]